MEEERVAVLNRMEDLQQKIKDLDNQMEECVGEVWCSRKCRGNVCVGGMDGFCGATRQLEESICRPAS